jgi:hypothetical protein
MVEAGLDLIGVLFLLAAAGCIVYTIFEESA